MANMTKNELIAMYKQYAISDNWEKRKAAAEHGIELNSLIMDSKPIVRMAAQEALDKIQNINVQKTKKFFSAMSDSEIRDRLEIIISKELQIMAPSTQFGLLDSVCNRLNQKVDIGLGFKDWDEIFYNADLETLTNILEQTKKINISPIDYTTMAKEMGVVNGIKQIVAEREQNKGPRDIDEIIHTANIAAIKENQMLQQAGYIRREMER